MDELLSWLRDNNAALTALFSLVVTGATVFYARLTHQLVLETRRMREAQTQPHVVVRVDSSILELGFLNLLVENVGQGPAYDVTFALDADFEMEKGRRLSQVGFVKHGLKYLSPRQKFTTFLRSFIGTPNEQLEGPDRLRFTIAVRYRDAAGKRFDERFEIDFAHLVNLMQIGHHPEVTVARSLEKIQKALTDIASGWSKPKVISYSPADIEREHDAFRLAQIGPQQLAELDAGSPDDDRQLPPAP